MNKSKYTIAVVVDTVQNWRNWVSEIVYDSKPAQISSNRFTLREFEFIRIRTTTDLRGCRFDGIVVTDVSINNSEYDEIMNLISVNMN